MCVSSALSPSPAPKISQYRLPSPQEYTDTAEEFRQVLDKKSSSQKLDQLGIGLRTLSIQNAYLADLNNRVEQKLDAINYALAKGEYKTGKVDFLA